MYGIGAAELVIIAFVALLVLGAPAVIGYFVGYTVGKKKAAEDDFEIVAVPDPSAQSKEDAPDV